ncbi:MAG: ABC transporter permease [Streptosporangiaceae bacterium]
MSTDVQGPSPEATEPDEETASEVALAAPEVMANSLGEYAKIWLSRVRNGDSGALPVILGLVAIVVYFQVRNSLFLSAGNLVNLIGQAALFATLGMAEVFVLLLGEIDLSIGYTAALGATFTCWLLLPPNPAPWPLAVLVGLAVPAIFSGLQGVITTRLRLPSFVVTLAGQLLALGLLLEVMDSAAPNGGGSIRLYNNVLTDIYSGSLSPVAGWIVMAAAVAGAGALFLVRDSRRRASNLTAPPLSVTVLKIAAMAVAGVVVVLIGNTNRGVGLTIVRGVPWVVLVVLVVVIAWSVLLGRTRFGRYIYAIGGNAEASRRAGINLSRIRVLAFTLCGLTAGIMGILYTSYLGSISTGIQGGQYVLYAVGAAVIGGTSLFGGRGKMVGAVLGGLVVAVIYNGLELLGLGAAPQYIWTAIVLLAAVTVDTLARRRSTAA